jgi:undecaprenyl-diphosphatase
MKKYLSFYLVFISFILFLLWTLFVLCVDVAAIGPNSSSIGLSTSNDFFRNLIGQNATCDLLSDVLFYLAFLIAGVFLIIGIIQLITRKSLKKVDKEIYAVGLGYIFVAIFYILFEIVVINYRPILDNGVLEASYPSSHTFISLFVYLSLGDMVKHFIKNKIIRISSYSLISILCISAVILRLFSGQHWFSDIIGGILLSFLIYSLFKFTLTLFKEKSQA